MDAEAIRERVRAKYGAVADGAEGHFPYPVGRASLQRLGYPAAWWAELDTVQRESFVGVGNPLALAVPELGTFVLDIGCGAGLDACVAARLVGPTGRAVGIDLTPAMVARAEAGARAAGLTNVTFVVGEIEALPFDDASFDHVLSNGVLNLVYDKPRAFREIHRVLRPGGVFQAADLFLEEALPPETLASLDAWST